MCGIFAFSLNRKLNSEDIKIGKEGLNLLKHRGPDDSNYWIQKQKGIFIGHNRLKIIDLSNKNSQPFKYKKSILSYNGEIYNFNNIKKDLISAGEKFDTKGDTEVLSRYLYLYGANGINNLDGMFAFVFYYKNKILLSNDPFGEKPLYILTRGNDFYFSSELTPLIKIFNLKLDVSQLEYELFMGLGYLPAHYTGYKNIVKLGPANYSEIDLKNRKLDICKYWEPNEVDKNDLKNIIEPNDIKEFKYQIIDSINSRLVSDVPIGVFLSSGIDSLLLTSLIKKELNKDILSLTVKFNSNDINDESVLAKKATNYLDVDHIIIDSEKNRIENELLFTKDIYGELNDNITVISSYLMSIYAKKYISVALNGTGGDELFFGYNKYSGLNTIYQLKNNLDSLNNILKLFPEYFLKKLPVKFQRFVKYLKVSNQDSFLLIKNYNGFEYLKQFDLLFKFLQKNISKNDIIFAGREFDINYSLPNTYIPYMERGSMKASLEVRSPYLNKSLYNFTNKFSSSALIAKGQKWVLKSILNQYLPSKYFNFPKVGFVNPRKEFIQRNFNETQISNFLYNANFSTNIDSLKPDHIDILLRHLIFKNMNK